MTVVDGNDCTAENIRSEMFHCSLVDVDSSLST
jgi:hypothetical protein